MVQSYYEVILFLSQTIILVKQDSKAGPRWVERWGRRCKEEYVLHVWSFLAVLYAKVVPEFSQCLPVFPVGHSAYV
jgi:hypothetical protein